MFHVVGNIHILHRLLLVLETIQEGIRVQIHVRSGCCVAGGNVAVLCTASFVPKLSVEEKNEALNGVGSLK